MTARDIVESDSEKPLVGQTTSWWTRKRKLIVAGAALFIVTLAIGLGAGLGVGLNQGGDDTDSGSSNDSNNGNGSGSGNGNGGNGGGNGGGSGSGNDNGNNGSNPSNGTTPTGPVANPPNVWQPAVGATWNLQLGQKVNSTSPNNTAVWDIDLYDTELTVIQGLQGNGAKVICYFSAGSWEDWRDDAGNFSAVDLGRTLDGWPNEKWLNTSSPGVRQIMLNRLDLAQQKGCDGVDPDNIDGYSNKNGLGLTKADSIDYMKWLAGAAQNRNMSIGLKNAGDIISDVIDYMQWSVNEQCLQFEECDTFAPFIDAGKPVFHVEYPKGDSTNNNQLVSTSVKDRICNSTTTRGFSTIIKNILLDAFIETC